MQFVCAMFSFYFWTRRKFVVKFGAKCFVKIVQELSLKTSATNTWKFEIVSWTILFRQQSVFISFVCFFRKWNFMYKFISLRNTFLVSSRINLWFKYWDRRHFEWVSMNHQIQIIDNPQPICTINQNQHSLPWLLLANR